MYVGGKTLYVALMIPPSHVPRGCAVLLGGCEHLRSRFPTAL